VWHLGVPTRLSICRWTRRQGVTVGEWKRLRCDYWTLRITEADLDNPAWRGGTAAIGCANVTARMRNRGRQRANATVCADVLGVTQPGANAYHAQRRKRSAPP
jgi:hypothetical protein